MFKDCCACLGLLVLLVYLTSYLGLLAPQDWLTLGRTLAHALGLLLEGV